MAILGFTTPEKLVLFSIEKGFAGKEWFMSINSR